MSDIGQRCIQEQPCNDLISLMSRTLSAANHLISKLLAEENIKGLVPSHGDILMCLFSNDVISMASLAESIGKDPSTVTALVKKLMDAGYVQTEKDACDKRITNVSLTKKGRGLKSSILLVNKKLLKTMGSGISEDDLNITRESLLRMKGNFEEVTA